MNNKHHYRSFLLRDTSLLLFSHPLGFLYMELWEGGQLMVRADVQGGYNQSSVIQWSDFCCPQTWWVKVHLSWSTSSCDVLNDGCPLCPHQSFPKSSSQTEDCRAVMSHLALWTVFTLVTFVGLRLVSRCTIFRFISFNYFLIMKQLWLSELLRWTHVLRGL